MPKDARVIVGISKDQVMEALRAMTFSTEAFDPKGWSLWDADVLEAAARLVRREIEAARRSREDLMAMAAVGTVDPPEILRAMGLKDGR